MNDAYHCVMAELDDMLMIRLMGKTGIVIEYLDNICIEYVLSVIIKVVESRDYLSLVIPWIRAALVKQVDIGNKPMQIGDCIRSLLKDTHSNISGEILTEAHKILMLLNKVIH